MGRVSAVTGKKKGGVEPPSCFSAFTLQIHRSGVLSTSGEVHSSVMGPMASPPLTKRRNCTSSPICAPGSSGDPLLFKLSCFSFPVMMVPSTVVMMRFRSPLGSVFSLGSGSGHVSATHGAPFSWNKAAALPTTL